MDDGFDENDLFESEYADDIDVLDELEGNTKPAAPSQGLSACLNEASNLPDINHRETNKRRKLFSPTKDENFCFDEFLPESDLIIDEEEISHSPKRKKPRLSSNLQNVKKPNLPTTLDVDRDRELQKLEDLKHKKCIGTPRIIEKIRKYRENKNDTKEFLSDGVSNLENQGSQIQLTKVLVHPPVHSDFMSATSSDGQRVYMRLRHRNKPCQVMSVNELVGGSKSSRLLPQSMSELRQIIFEEKKYDVIEESKRITEEIRRDSLQLSNTLTKQLFSDSTMSVDDENTEDEGIYSGEEASLDGLWVNKYAPTRYTHLLSDETVNRALLKWLKLWDLVVFGRELQLRKPAEPEQATKHQKFKNKFTKKPNSAVLDEELDENNRPKFKAALLCGPPGLGKTTLAHIIAKHAGYHVVEMNASDDRSSELFKKKLEETTQMKSVLGSDQRPNCLIIDEIDGAPQAAINVLLNAMNKVRKTDRKKKNARKDANSILLRPIICICNDLYVPALRQLRQQSYVLQFPPTTSARLASRLRQMCFLQRLDCDMTSLLALCEKSSNDIRTCINTLQFVQSKGETKVSAEMIKNLSIGQKDQHKSIFYVWGELFQLPKNKRKMEQDSRTVQQSMEGQKVSQFSTRFYHILNVVHANGEYEKTLQGVFENFLKMKFKDSGMHAINKACDWLMLYDQLTLETMSHQEWVLMGYTPYIFILFHLLFSCISPPRTQFPQSAQENKTKLQKNNNLLSSMYADMSPAVRCFTSPSVAVLDLVPYLLAIMTPNLRPVNMQLYSPGEKKQLRDLVSSLLSYNLTYRQERNEEGQYTYVLEPNMTDVCNFPEEGASAKRQLSYAIKQIISKEVDMERMRRSEKLMTGKFDHSNKENVEREETKSKKEETSQTHVPNHLKRLAENIKTIAVPVDKPVVNFFSRFTKVKKVDEHGAEKPSKKVVEIHDPGIGNSQLWYRYNEGFSNAVRRTVYVKDFL